MKKIPIFILLFFGLTQFPSSLFGTNLTLHFSEPKIIKAGQYKLLEVSGLKSYGSPGCPVLPFQTVKILIPFGQEVNTVEAVPHGKKEINGDVFIKPGQHLVPISKKNKVPYKSVLPKEDVYQSAAAYPKSLFKISPIQNVKGYSILTVNLFPYQYTPAGRKVSYYQQIELNVTFKKIGSVTPATRKLLRRLPKDDASVRKLVDNSEDVKSYSSVSLAPLGTTVLGDSGPYDYVIITNQALSASFQTLIAQKVQRGLRARIVTIEEISINYPGADEQEKIRNFIFDAYTNWQIDYVLLGGDTEVVPFRGVYGSCEGEIDTNMPSDMYYGCLDGTWDENGNGIYGEPDDNVDFFAEVYVGRAPVETELEVQNFVNKTIAYELSFGDPYLKKVLLVGEKLWDDPETWGGDFKDVIEPLFPTPQYEIAKRYDKLGNFNGNGELIIQDINQGQHLINHLGHADVWLVMWIGDWEFYDMSEEEGDIANEKPCFVYSQGCYSGAFDQGGLDSFGLTDECVGENFVASQYGAFAVVMNSRYGFFQPGDIAASPSQQFDYQFWDAIFTEGIRNLGRANQDSKDDNYGVLQLDTTGGYRWCCFELNLLGDPETSIGGSVSRAGRIFFDRGSYNDGQQVKLTVLDMDLNVNHESVDTVNIPLFVTGGDSETLTLTETDANTGEFSGTITLQSGSPVPGNNILEASHGATITATYLDADDGLGSPVTRTATSQADFTASVISNVQVTSITDTTATITWTTDEPASSKVIYGTTAPPGTTNNTSTLVISHSVNLQGLSIGTTYYFKVESQDEAGNTASDDNSGSYYSFTTKTAVVVLQYDVESGQGDWQVSYLSDSGETPTYNWYITENWAYSGTHSWHYCREEWSEEDGGWIFFYNPGALQVHGYLTSPVIDLTLFSSARLRFAQILSNGDGGWFDYAKVEISIDNGATWELIQEKTGTGGTWSEENIDLTSYVGHTVKIRFHFYCEDDIVSSVYNGWFIDDVKIESLADAGEIISITVAPNSWEAGSATLSEVKSTAENHFTTTNNGNVAETFTIITGNSTNWTAGDSAGSETFAMEVKGGDLSSWTNIRMSNMLKSNVVVSGSTTFGLRLSAPTATDSVGIQQTINVTITASKTP